MKEAQQIGYWAGQWAESLLMQRGVEGMRTLYGLRNMTHKHSSQDIDTACETALGYGAFRLRDLRRIMADPSAETQTHFTFLEEHELIRDLSEYQGLFTNP